MSSALVFALFSLYSFFSHIRHTRSRSFWLVFDGVLAIC
jgi:hypothetical protein